MKNLRKIVAILAAALMIFSVLPMSAFAADGDVILDINFNDGDINGFNGGAAVVAEGPDGSNCLKWTATGSWSSTEKAGVKTIKANTDYTATFMVKASVNGNMGITIQNGDWGEWWNGPAFAVTTEWEQVVYTFNSANLPNANGSILFKFQDVGEAMDLYIDDLVIVEGAPKVPLCENGDFEAGAEGWGLNQSTAINATAAKNGALGAHLKGNGGWGSMLERTFDTEAGKNYELSFWIKAIASGTNIQVKDQTWQGAAIAGAGGWFNNTEWTQITYIFTAVSDKTYLNFCGSGDAAEELYVDDVNLLEIKDPSFDGYIYNGDFEIGKLDFATNESNATGAWINLWGSTSATLVDGHTGDYAIQATAGSWNQIYQPVAVNPNTNYTVACYSKDAVNASLWIKNSAGQGDLANTALNGGSDWGLTTLTFNSGSNNVVWVGLMGTAAGATYTVDDVFMFEAKAESYDGYIYNGDFETGSVSPWDNLWGSCPTVEIVKGGKDDNFSINIVSGEWKHVRQTDIAVEANTDYKISLWAKNVVGMNLLVKDNGDDHNISNKGIEGGEDWTYNEFTFNTGADTSVLVSLMGGAAEAYGQFDNIVMEKVAPTCEHEYDNCLDEDCNLCGEPREAGHNLEYTPAKDAIDCLNPGNVEYWYCSGCYEYFSDAEGLYPLNPWFIEITVDCVRPEDAADCATVPCTVCGNDIYGYGEHDVVACQGGVCGKCGDTIEGYGCANYDTPACMDGVCYYCGGFVAGFGHENGAWAACCDGECAYGCGLQYPATQDHVDAEGDDYCDTCWTHLAHVFDVNGFDPCYGGECDICWTWVKGEHVYFDDCSAICEVCGEETREVSHNVLHVEAVAATCNLGGNIEYWYCDVCGMAWLDADCLMNTNIRAVKTPATGEHVYDDEYDADCNECGDVRDVPEKPADEILYGDADGDGEITGLDSVLLQQYLNGYEVELNAECADADGDGEITGLDSVLLQQYLNGYEVELGPEEEAKQFNDGVLGW